MLDQYLKEGLKYSSTDSGVLTCPIARSSIGMEANSQYFSHPVWSQTYLEACHQDQHFRDRWQSALSSWDDKVVVDIGCGPGNIFANLGGYPKILIGVDISLKALEMAKQAGYTPILADAQQLPLKSGCADIVVANATLHHCDDMTQVLAEASRLVKPNGLLVTDHDPQQTAYCFNGVGRLLWAMRLPLYRAFGRGGHTSLEEQRCSLMAEIHHKPGAGVSPNLFHQVLAPQGFEVKLFPHNHSLGSQVFKGELGQAKLKYRITQSLSGINPSSPEAALSIMCVAKRKLVEGNCQS